jgi:hypothetical protein
MATQPSYCPKCGTPYDIVYTFGADTNVEQIDGHIRTSSIQCECGETIQLDFFGPVLKHRKVDTTDWTFALVSSPS